MKVVGIKVLKNKLSSYLRMVRAGEVVLVSDRDEVVAEIRRPTRVPHSGLTRFEAFAEEAVLRGAMHKPAAKELFPKSKADLLTPPLQVEALELLSESRAERS